MGAIALAKECVKDPLPVPLSNTVGAEVQFLISTLVGSVNAKDLWQEQSCRCDSMFMMVPMQPGLSSRKVQIMLMSATYKICVLCFNTVVHSSGVGASRYTQPVLPRPDDSTRLPKGFPTQS